VPHVLTAASLLAIACLLPPTWSTRLVALSLPEAAELLAIAAGHLAARWYAYSALAVTLYYALSSRPPVYLLDFAVFEPPGEWQVRGERQLRT
jgi:hypothetical protein